MDSALSPALEVMGARYWGWLSAEHEYSVNLGAAVCLKQKGGGRALLSWGAGVGGSSMRPIKGSMDGCWHSSAEASLSCELFSGPCSLTVCCQLRLG